MREKTDGRDQEQIHLLLLCMTSLWPRSLVSVSVPHTVQQRIESRAHSRPLHRSPYRHACLPALANRIRSQARPPALGPVARGSLLCTSCRCSSKRTATSGTLALSEHCRPQLHACFRSGMATCRNTRTCQCVERTNCIDSSLKSHTTHTKLASCVQVRRQEELEAISSNDNEQMIEDNNHL